MMKLDMETQTFATSADFLEWAKRVVREKDERYARVPVGKQTWVYGDGHIDETGMGGRGGTLLSNLSYLRSTGTGALESPGDQRIVDAIDTRGGVVLVIRWANPEPTADNR